MELGDETACNRGFLDVNEKSLGPKRLIYPQDLFIFNNLPATEIRFDALKCAMHVQFAAQRRAFSSSRPSGPVSATC